MTSLIPCMVAAASYSKVEVISNESLLVDCKPMERIYMDNGSALKAHDSVHVLSDIGVHFVFGTVGYPQGRGKVQRFNQAVWNDCLRYLDGHAAVPTDCEASHSGCAITSTPPISAVFLAPSTAPAPRTDFMRIRSHCVSPPHIGFTRPFSSRFGTKVSADDAVSINGDIYEVPLGYSGQHRLFARHAVDGTVRMIHENTTITLCPVDLYRNASRPGGMAVAPNLATTQALPGGSAYTQFTTDFQPLVDQSGDCFDTKEASDKQNS